MLVQLFHEFPVRITPAGTPKKIKKEISMCPETTFSGRDMFFVPCAVDEPPRPMEKDGVPCVLVAALVAVALVVVVPTAVLAVAVGKEFGAYEK